MNHRQSDTMKLLHVAIVESLKLKTRLGKFLMLTLLS